MPARSPIDCTQHLAVRRTTTQAPVPVQAPITCANQSLQDRDEGPECHQPPAVRRPAKSPIPALITRHRTEKKVLNAINQRPYSEGGCRFPVLEAPPAAAAAADEGKGGTNGNRTASAPRKVKARIQTAAEKIQILVSQHRLMDHPAQPHSLRLMYVLCSCPLTASSFSPVAPNTMPVLAAVNRWNRSIENAITGSRPSSRQLSQEA